MSSCACGHHHAHAPVLIAGGRDIALDRPLVAVEGRLICADMQQMLLALDLLPEHAGLSRAEPGNLRFDLQQDDDPLVWRLDELFTDADAFASHQARSADSRWGKDSAGITRDITRSDILPRIRPEAAQDQTALRGLLRRAFKTDAEAQLLDRLRDAGDLAASLVADAHGTVIGHLALSPLAASRPALALAPVAVAPAMQRRGIGAALIREAIRQFSDDHLIVVLGDPAYYARFGFAPVAWTSPYAGPALQALGPDLPADLTITHAPAFGAMV